MERYLELTSMSQNEFEVAYEYNSRRDVPFEIGRVVTLLVAVWFLDGIFDICSSKDFSIEVFPLMIVMALPVVGAAYVMTIWPTSVFILLSHDKEIFVKKKNRLVKLTDSSVSISGWGGWTSLEHYKCKFKTSKGSECVVFYDYYSAESFKLAIERLAERSKSQITSNHKRCQ